MGRVVHFEIPVNNIEVNKKFYETVFHWKITQWGDEQYYLIDTGDGMGINGGMMERRDPTQPIVNSIEVESLDESVGAIEAAGGTIVVPKMPIPTVGWLAYFKDPDGNIFGIMEPDSEAK